MSNHLKKFAKIISYFCLFILISGLVLYFAPDLFSLFKKVNPWILSLCILLQIPMIASGGYAFHLLCKAQHIHLKWQEWTGLSFVANFLNQLLPYRPGVGFRFLYMRQHYQMTTSQYIYIMLIYLLLTLLVSCGFTFIGWFKDDLANNFNHLMLCAVGLSIAIIVGLLLVKRLLPLFHAKVQKEGEPSLLSNFNQALVLLLNNPVVLIGTTLSLICVNALTAIIFYLLFMSTGSALPLADCFFLVGIIVLSMIVPITPGNIGVLETIVGTLTQMLYHDFSLGFGVTVLFRASQWLPSILLGTGFSLLLVGSLIPKFKGFKLGASQSVD